MRKIVIAIAIATMLSACNAALSGISGIQQAVVKACGFLPTVSTVENLLNLNSPILVTVNDFAKAICNAVTIKGGAGGPSARGPGAATPTVLGVQIHGKFVK